jgi:hypothetical protein
LLSRDIATCSNDENLGTNRIEIMQFATRANKTYYFFILPPLIRNGFFMSLPAILNLCFCILNHKDSEAAQVPGLERQSSRNANLVRTLLRIIPHSVNPARR